MCVYNDYSLYIWDVKDMKKIGKVWLLFYYSMCVWGVEVNFKFVGIDLVVLVFIFR